MLWIFIGSKFFMTYVPLVDLPPVNTDQCTSNFSTSGASTLSATEFTYFTQNTDYYQQNSPTFDQLVYSVNFHYYTLIGSLITITFGLLVSFITGRNDPRDLDPKLFMPVLDNKLLPEKLRKFLRFGVPELEEPKKNESADEEMLELFKP